MLKKKKKKIDKLSLLAIILILISTVSIVSMTTVEDYVLSVKQRRAMEQAEKVQEKANDPNSNELDVSKSELSLPIATLLIPKLELKLPIYDLPDSGKERDIVLDNGIGLVRRTGDIKGGLNNNPLLSGHNGLRASNLFTRLPEIETNDKFFIKIGNDYHAYQVKRQKTVDANLLESQPALFLLPSKNKDQMTLMTCVPRYINNKRLLVTGERVDYNYKDLLTDKNKKATTKKGLTKIQKILLCVAAIFAFSISVYKLSNYFQNNQRREK